MKIKQSKIAVIAPYFYEKWRKTEFSCKENLSIAYLSAYLEAQGHLVKMINAQLYELSNENVINKLKDEPYTLFAISCSAQKLYLNSKNLIRKIRSEFPSAHIIMGGVFPSVEYENILKDIEELDGVIVGEGEYSLDKLYKEIVKGTRKFETVEGYAFRKDGEVHLLPPKRIEDLTSLPFPKRDWNAFDMLKHKMAYIVAGKGCYGKCSYCSIQDSFGYRRKIYRSPENVISEIQSLIEKYNIQYIQFHDDIFYDYSKKGKAWINKFIDEIKKRNLKFTFRIYLRANDIKENEISRLKEIGLQEVFIGVESGVERVLKEMNKRMDPKEIIRGIKVLKKYNINIALGYITIVPTMSFKELCENYKFIYELGVYNEANLHNRLNIYNGCLYEKILAEKGLLDVKENFWDIHSYRFEDDRVRMYHDELQQIKKYAMKSKMVLNDIRALCYVSNKENILERCEKKNLEMWKYITSSLLKIVDKEYPKLTNESMKNIFSKIDSTSDFLSEILQECSE